MEIRIPTEGESEVQALLAKWHKPAGSMILKDDVLCEIEAGKITSDIYAEVSGRLVIGVQAGTILPVGSVIAQIVETYPQAEDQLAVTATGMAGSEDAPTSPAVRQALRQQGRNAAQLAGSGPGGRILMDDLNRADAAERPVSSPPAAPQVMSVKSEEMPPYLASGSCKSVQPAGDPGPGNATELRPDPQPVPGEEQIRISPLRKRISEHLLQTSHQTAALSIFNEVDLGTLLAVRTQHKRAGAPVGLLPFFVRATVEALQSYPPVNARIDGDEVVYQQFVHLGIAMSGEQGQVVPVLRDADQLGLREIDEKIAGLEQKAATNRLASAQLEDGTFTISNGGSYGSMLSTPLVSPFQSGGLGMHAIQDRPVARNGRVVIRPMMYLALSYDQRIIDGREAAAFLKLIKERVEDRAWLEGLS